MMRQFVYGTIAVMFLAGCVTIGSVEKDLSKIDYNDGVNAKEAVVIAQKNLISGEARGDFLLSVVTVESQDTSWQIIFAPKNLNMFNDRRSSRYIVEVDRANGAVLKAAVVDNSTRR